tara:strand:- start:492 stop:1913 length:1422 start_codon:yes stop_codon:yes gene_type:complete
VAHPTNPRSEQDGELFASRYRKVELLGAGGMGTVWLAEKSGPGNFTQRVVIKQIHEHMAKQPEFVTRFEDEARLAGLLHHPNIVRVEDFGNADDVLYLVMEHVQGSELHELVQNRGQLPIPIVLAMAIDIAKALAYAHDLTDYEGNALKVVHRDVSPQNIMITQTGDAKLLDFGIARATSNQVETRVGIVKGKLGYLSPEQVEGRPLDGRSDQFTLGIVLYELLSGRRLFDGKSDLGILTRIQKADVPHLGRLATDLPDGLSSIIMRCLQRAPSARFDDCNQLARALGNSLRVVGGRLPSEDFQHWWEHGDFIGNPHRNPKEASAATAQVDTTTVAPEEATVIAAVDKVQGQVAPRNADTALAAETEDFESNGAEEPTRLISSELLTRKSEASNQEADDAYQNQPPAHGESSDRIEHPRTGQQHNDTDHQSLGGPVATLVLLALAILIAVFGFQAIQKGANPSDALVDHSEAP